MWLASRGRGELFRSWTTVGLLAAAIAGWAVFGDSSPASEPTPSAADEAAKLIPQLGSDQFAVRETTTTRLMQMGIAIKPALVAALEDSDMEIRARARRILATVVEADFQHRLSLFAADVDDAKHYVLPGWKQYRETVGGDRTARDLFVEMQRSEPELLQAFDDGREPAARMLETRVRISQNAFNGRVGGGSANLSLGSVAALLYVASDKHVTVTEDYASLVGNLAYHQSFRQSINSGAYAAILKKILGGWIARDVSQNLASQNMYLALQFDLKEGLGPAIRVLQQPATPAHVKPVALLTVARFGGKDQLPLAESQLGSSEICSRIDVNGSSYTTQVRDVALYACLKLADQEPKSFGFDRITQADQAFMQITNLGFRAPADRDNAFKKWTEWRIANLQSADVSKPAQPRS